jgi:hypothetical protein
VEKQPAVHLEVTDDDNTVEVALHGEVILNLEDTGGDSFTIRLNNVIYYVLDSHKECVFSVSQFCPP